MVRTSGIREKLRSNVLQSLARERAAKRLKTDDNLRPSRLKGEPESASSDDEDDTLSNAPSDLRETSATNSLVSILPRPKNASAFGPTIRLDQILKMPERAEDAIRNDDDDGNNTAMTIGDDGMVEVDIGKVVQDVSHNAIKDLTIEKATTKSVMVPKGKEKQKNQITYLAQLGKATELERKEQAAQNRQNKAAARAKYGW